jgi:hypothetical protein
MSEEDKAKYHTPFEGINLDEKVDQMATGAKK